MVVVSEGGETTGALSGKLSFEQGKDRIIGREPSNLARLIILANGTEFSMKISEDGVDVTTATEEQLIFNSNNNLFKIVSSGEVTLSLPIIAAGSTGITSQQVAHGQPNPPLVIAFSTVESPLSPGTFTTKFFGTTTTGYGAVGTTSMTVTYMSIEEVTANSTFITFGWRVANSTGLSLGAVNAVVKYYILTETAN